MKNFMILLLILLVSCQTKGTLKKAEPILWERHDLVVPGANGSLGGIDVTRTSDGSLHAALIMQIYDIENDITFFKLFYFYQIDGQWMRREMKSSRAPFHLVYGGNNPTNFVRIVMNRLDQAQIFYVDRLNNLQRLSIDASEAQVAEGVRNFTVTYDDHMDDYHVVTTGSGDNRDSISYYKISDSNQVLASEFYDGVDFTQIDPAHVELLFKDDGPIILTKTAGKFIKIENGEVIILSNGERASSIFNAYWKDGEIKTCRRGSKIDTGPVHCLVSEDKDFPNVRYNNYQPYNHALVTPTMVYTALPLLEIKLLRYQDGEIVSAGLDFESGQPVILLKSI
jgi:hypothetical protein